MSDGDLAIAPDGHFGFVLSATKPTDDELDGQPWVEIPDDASALVVREYIADRAVEELASLSIDPLDPSDLPPCPPTMRWPVSSRGWRGPSPSSPRCTAPSSRS